jgi:hypothetical protein
LQLPVVVFNTYRQIEYANWNITYDVCTPLNVCNENIINVIHGSELKITVRLNTFIDTTLVVNSVESNDTTFYKYYGNIYNNAQLYDIGTKIIAFSIAANISNNVIYINITIYNGNNNRRRQIQQDNIIALIKLPTVYTSYDNNVMTVQSVPSTSNSANIDDSKFNIIILTISGLIFLILLSVSFTVYNINAKINILNYISNGLNNNYRDTNCLVHNDMNASNKC